MNKVFEIIKTVFLVLSPWIVFFVVIYVIITNQDLRRIQQIEEKQDNFGYIRSYDVDDYQRCTWLAIKIHGPLKGQVKNW